MVLGSFFFFFCYLTYWKFSVCLSVGVKIRGRLSLSLEKGLVVMEASLAEAQVLGQETEACVSEMWSPLTAPKPEVCSFLGDPEGAASPPDPAHELMSENLQLKVVEDLSLDLLRWWERCPCALFSSPPRPECPCSSCRIPSPWSQCSQEPLPCDCSNSVRVCDSTSDGFICKPWCR